ncbi:MAG TPA: sigma-70 family RNA polymerase sigma factor [Chthonomonadaceae bacterium]|nr:sigma-70 family RNA polymerase sigma factor [Chthonomonadaceae bacterium]
MTLERQRKTIQDRSISLQQHARHLCDRALETIARSKRSCRECAQRRQRLQALHYSPSTPARSLRTPATPRLPRTERLADNALIERCKANDPEAWKVLIDRYQERIYGYAHSLCGNDADAGDITAEVLIRVYQNIQSYRQDATSFRAWALRITRNTYVDVCIRNRDHGHLSLSAPLHPDDADWTHQIKDRSPSPEAICLEKESVHRLMEGIRYLPDYQREVLTLFVQGRTYEQIMAQTGLSMGTVKSRLNRARKMLSERCLPESQDHGSHRWPEETGIRSFSLGLSDR